MKPREWWIKWVDCHKMYDVFSTEISQVPPEKDKAIWDDFNKSTHVIEYAAYEKLEAEVIYLRALHEQDTKIIDGFTEMYKRLRDKYAKLCVEVGNE